MWRWPSVLNVWAACGFRGNRRSGRGIRCSEGAQQTLNLCLRYGIKYAVLKEGSPSCGSREIYDGSFQGRRISGQGVTAALLQAHGIQVYSENNWEALLPLIHREETAIVP